MSKRKYKIGDEVCLITDIETLPRIITKYEVSKQGALFCLSQGVNISWHGALEIKPYEKRDKPIGLTHESR